MAKEDFILNAVKERVIEGLNLKMTHLSNWSEVESENNQTLALLQDENKMREVVQILIDNAKLECQNAGMIPGNKEILSIVNAQKAREYAVDYMKRS